MKKLLAVLLVTVFALQASATTTWSTGSSARVSVATCSTGSESAPTLATHGLALGQVSSFTVVAETAGTMTAGGVLQAYYYNPESASWVRAPDMDLIVQALAKQAFPGFQVTSNVGRGERIAFIPSGVGVAVTVYIVGSLR
jgi:hypothetical protein